MTDEFLAACRDVRLLTTFWFFCTIACAIVAIHFGCLYAFGIRLRLPRMRSTMKRLARERDTAKAQAIRAELDRSADQTKASTAQALLRSKAETIGIEAQKELDRVDAIRRKTEDRLVFQNAELDRLRADLAEERDLRKTLEQFLAAVEGQTSDAAASWVDQASVAALAQK